MKVKVNNFWKSFEWNVINDPGQVTFFEIVWQFDNSRQVLWMVIFNFEIEFDWS